MGYFGRLRARARNKEGWSDYKYTGSASAGADIVSENTWCVVYAAEVNYQGSGENLTSLSLSTNFVNPLSSGNPCTVSCYLYTFDPTNNGSFAVDAPPAGFYSAVSHSFEASTVGDYVTFSFGTTGIRPAQVYFWFTSTVTYESYGSNSIYHYATGNYDSTVNSGTKTPLLTGGFTGTDTGDSGGGGTGGGTGGSYRVVPSGSYSGIYTKWDFSYSRTQRDASYTALSFSSGGTVNFSCQHGSGGDNFLQMRCYLTLGSGFDIANGRPTGMLVASASGGDNITFSAQVTSGQTYYLWTVIDYCGTATVPLNISIDPGGWNYSIADKGSQLSLDRTQRSFSMSMGKFQTGRMTLSFAYSAGVDIAVTASEGAFTGTLYISEQPDIDSSTGRPLSYITSFNAGTTGYLNVLKGKIYYFFAVFNGGSDAGNISFRITAPAVLWYQGGSTVYSLLEGSKSFSTSLTSFRYHFLQVSFAYTGTARISCTNASVGDGEIWLYFGENADIDSSNGLALGWEETYAGRTINESIEVVAGKTYHFIIRNGLPSYNLSGTFTITAPQIIPSYTKILQTYRYLELDASESQELERYSFSENKLSYKFRGKTVISGTKAANQSGKTLHLRAYLTSEEGMNTQSGVPYGPILASYTGQGESFTLECQVQEEREYYLYIVSSEIYSAAEGWVDLNITAPLERFFSVTESREFYDLWDTLDYSASPGESGVLRLELNFAKNGSAKITANPKNGASVPLCAYLAYTPYLDSRTGAPYEIISSVHGSEDEPEVELSLNVRKNGSYYLFVRCMGIYDKADFDVCIKCMSAAVNIYSHGEFLRAQPYVYHEGAWHMATPLCRHTQSWISGG